MDKESLIALLDQMEFLLRSVGREDELNELILENKEILISEFRGAILANALLQDQKDHYKKLFEEFLPRLSAEITKIQ